MAMSKSTIYWHYICYALAAISFLTIASSLYLNNQVTSIFSESVKTNSVWAEHAATLNKLNQLATAADAPGNNVFETRDIDGESLQLEETISHFLTEIVRFKKEVAETVESPRAFVGGIDSAINDMTMLAREANNIFDALKEGDELKAGIHMAVMDRHYAEVITTLGKLSEKILAKQQGLFEVKFRAAETYQRFEIVFASVISAITLAVTLYGHGIARKFRTGEEARAETNTLYQESLRELEFQKLAFDKHAIVSIADLSGRITYANERFQDVSGYSEEELIGQNHRLVKSQEHSPEFYLNMWSTITKGRVWHGVIKNRKKDGTPYWVDSTIVPFVGPKGIPERYIGIRTDITEQVTLTESLAEAKAEAEAANISKSEFLASMSHEVRTPMTAVMGLADLLLKERLSESARDKVGKIKDSTRSLLVIINDILDMSKMEAGKLEIEQLDIHVPSLIEEVIALFFEKRTGDRATSITLTTELAEGFPATCRTDPTRLRQVLVNLIGNAMKFTSEGSITIRGMLVRRPNGDGRIRLEVEDTGIGISSKVIDKLFMEFAQADSSITRKFDGTGLGLAICKRLVELQNGSIGVESKLGVGSTFWFELPYIKPRSQIAPGCVFGSDTQSDVRVVRPLNILIAEDNPLNQEIICAIVRGFGHAVDAADDGEEMLSMHADGDFDLILSDVRMPNLSGPDATKLIRQLPGKKSEIPIIALTADVMEENKKSYIDAGMNGVVSKPIEPMLLVGMIEEVIGETIHEPADENDDSFQCANDVEEDSTLSTPSEISIVAETLGLPKPDVDKLLLNFADLYGDAADQIRTELETDREAALRLAHSLKGLSETLRIKPVTECARLAESAIEKQDSAGLTDTLSRLERIMPSIVRNIRENTSA